LLGASSGTLEPIIHPEHMRLQGKVKTWHDEKGYGFVEQNGGGERVFLHISAFGTRSLDIKPGCARVVAHVLPDL
jgi:hypothetical protein